MCPHDRPVAAINLSPGDPSSGFYGIREHVSVGVSVTRGGYPQYRIGTAKNLLAAKNGDKNVWRQRALEWI